MSSPRVALLGLGAMGTGMAGRLLTGGFATTVYNRHREKAEPLAHRGATVADSPAAAAANADFVISMVADDQASRAVWLGDNGVLKSARAGAVLIECSTLTVSWVRELADAATKRGCEFLDAPVTGSKPQAAAGQLLFVCGGAAATIEKARSILSAMARGIVHVGPTGSGALVKLANNFLCGVQAAATAEAIAMLKTNAVDFNAAWPVLAEGAPGSPIVKRIGERAAQQDFVPAFTVGLMLKDLIYAMDTAANAGLHLHTAAQAIVRFHQAVKDGMEDLDFAAVTKSVQNNPTVTTPDTTTVSDRDKRAQ